MLGDTTLQKWYGQADSLTVQPKVIIEWNANEMSKIQAFGQGDGTATSFSMNSTVSVSGTADDSYRFCFSAISKTDPVTVTVTTIAKDSAGTILNQFSEVIDVYPTEANDYFIDAFTYNSTKTISSISINYIVNNGAPQDINITNLNMYKISQSETIKYPYTSVKDIFSSVRPGEPYVDGVTDLNTNVSPYYLAYYSFLGGSSAVARNFIPNVNAAFKYHFYQAPGNGNFFAIYKSTFKTNKMVIKVNSSGTIPSSLTIQTTPDGTSWSGTTISSPFDSTGLCVLYWNGTAWTKTAPTTPKYSNATLPANILTAKGVKASFTASSGEVHVVEISPRLELDVSDYAKSFSITKELSEDSLPIPVGVSNSNTLSVSLSNIPETNGTVPFNQYAGALSGMFRKGPKIKVYVQSIDINVGGTDVETLVGTYNIATWDFSDISSVSITGYDKIKTLSTIPCPVFYLKQTNVTSIINAILDNIGFTDYRYQSLLEIDVKIPNNIIPHFWTDINMNALEAIQEILTPYQIAMYCDEYNAIRFKHISGVDATPSGTYALSDSDTYVDSLSGLYTTAGAGRELVKANIVDFSEIQEPNPSSIKVEYTVAAPVEYNQATAQTSLYRSTRYVDVWKPEANSALLGYVGISSPISATEKDVISYDNNLLYSALDSYVGYLLVGNEIIHFDGVEYTFTSVGTGQSITKIIRSAEEVDLFKAELLTTDGIIDVGVTNTQPNNTIKLRNLTRGCFGTPVEAHSSAFNASTEFIFKQDVYAAPDRVSATRATGQVFDGVNNYGSLLMKEINLPTTTEDRYIVFKNQSITDEHRLFAASFDLPVKTQLPNGKPVEFGLLIGANPTATAADGLYVGIKVVTERKGSLDYKLSESIIIQQYVGGTVQTNKEYRIYSNKNAAVNKKYKKSSTYTNTDNSYINLYGNNNLAVYLANSAGLDDVTSGYSRAVIVVNGAVITLENDAKNNIPLTNNVANSNKYTYNMSAVSLSSPLTLTGKYFGAYTTGRRNVSLNYMQALGAVGDSATESKKNNLNLLSSVISGNSMGISNKSEIDAVVFGRKQYDSYDVVEFRPQSVGREIKVFDQHYSGSPVVTYPTIIRSDYINEVAVTSNLIGQIRVPAESITFSAVNHNPISGRFAIINSYNSPVYINKPSGGPSGEQTITVMTGKVLKRAQRGSVTNVIDRTGFEASSVTLKSDWIQSEELANRVLSNISTFAIMKRARLEIKAFGNPLVTIGDVLYVQNLQRSLPAGKYIVTAVTHSFSNGIETNITLRRIQE